MCNFSSNIEISNKLLLDSFDLSQITKDYYTDTVLSREKELEKLEASEPGKSFATLFGKSPAQVKEEKIISVYISAHITIYIMNCVIYLRTYFGIL